MANKKLTQLPPIAAGNIEPDDLFLVSHDSGNGTTFVSVSIAKAQLDLLYLSSGITFGQIGGTVSINQLPIAGASTSGALTYTDWNAFNSKEQALVGNIAQGVTITGSTITVVNATGAQTGVLSSMDWTTFNSKLNSFNADIAVGLTFANGLTLTSAIASGSQIGVLASADWNTFNNKQSALTADNAKGVTITGSTLTIATASGSLIGVLAAADWTTFNSKQAAITADNAKGVTLNGATLTIATATTSLTGVLSSTDWNTFNNKQIALKADSIPGMTITGTTLTQLASSGSQNGYLSSTNFTTFNSKQGALTGNTAQGITINGSTITINTFGQSLVGVIPGSPGGTSFFIRSDSSWATISAGTGTVTSVAMTVPSFLSVAGSPITTVGTFGVTYSGTALPILNGGSGVTSSDPVIQRVSTVTGAVATGTTLTPFSDSIPTTSNGNQYMSLAITPQNVNNILVIEAICNFTSSVSTQITVALHQDSTANALAAVGTHTDSGGAIQNSKLTYVMAAGTTSTTTFKIRIGGNNTGTITFNGSAGGRIYGGVMASSIIITEYTS